MAKKPKPPPVSSPREGEILTRGLTEKPSVGQKPPPPPAPPPKK